MALKKKQHRAVALATQSIYDALVGRGVNSVLAQQVAAGLLQRPGVVLTAGGKIKYRGQRYSPAAFADSKLARLLSGETATSLNEAAIKGDPGYLQTQAQLDMERNQNLAALDQQRQRAILDYGSGAYTTNPLLAGQAEANPFSISKLLAQAYARNQQGVQTAANRAGTLFGGGVRSGLGEAERQNASQRTDATRSLVDLLSNLNTQEGAQNQAYGLGLSQASLDAQQRLIAAGLLHAAQPTPYNPTGHYHFGGFGGTGGKRHWPPPPNPPPRHGDPRPGAGGRPGPNPPPRRRSGGFIPPRPRWY